jgi:enoyl-CoA hydratase/carnithine racemase
MSDYQTIRLDFEPKIARLTLHRPERLNALDPTMLAELIDALQRVRNRPGLSALYLQGSGRCSM